MYCSIPRLLKYRTAALLAALWCVSELTLANVAEAQESPPPQQESPPQAASGGGGLEVVTVTAERRAENLQTVPATVTALSQNELRANAITTFNDLQYIVPSLTLVDAASRNEQFVSIRGISGLATDGQAVVTYMNEMPLPPGPLGGTGGSGPGLFFDLDNIQVLNGPQGTLFGRNTIGGAVLYESKRPTENFEGYIEGTYGSYNNREVQGAVNLPITDQVFVRVAFNDIHRDGFTKSLGTGTHPSGWDLDNRNVAAGRVTVTYRPSDNLQNDIIYSYLDSYDHGSSQILTYLDPNGAALAAFPGIAATLAQQQALGIRTQVATDAPDYSYSTLQTFEDILRYNLSPNLTFRNIAGLSQLKALYADDNDGSPFPVYQYGGKGRPFGVKTYSEEPQFLGQFFDNTLTVTVGGYYETRTREPAYRRSTTVFGGGRILDIIGYLNTAGNSHALYGQAAYDLSQWIPNLKFTAGYRYSWDSVYQQNRKLLANGTCANPPPAGFDANCTVTGTGKFGGANWNVGLDYQVTPQTLLYIVSRHGYHAGGINIGAPGALGTYQPEQLTDVELGVKSDWEAGGIRGRTNASLYNFDYSRIQTLQIVPSPDGTLVPVFGNASSARTWGAEVEATIIPMDSLEIGFQFDWLDFQYTGFGPGVDSAELIYELPSNKPRFKYGFNARYYIPIDESLGDASVMARWSWQDRSGISALLTGPNPDFIQNAYGLLSLGADWNNIGGSKLGAQFYMSNALNQKYKTGGFLFATAFGFDTVTYGEPRMFGFRLHYQF